MLQLLRMYSILIQYIAAENVKLQFIYFVKSSLQNTSVATASFAI